MLSDDITKFRAALCDGHVLRFALRADPIDPLPVDRRGSLWADGARGFRLRIEEEVFHDGSGARGGPRTELLDQHELFGLLETLRRAGATFEIGPRWERSAWAEAGDEIRRFTGVAAAATYEALHHEANRWLYRSAGLSRLVDVTVPRRAGEILYFHREAGLLLSAMTLTDLDAHPGLWELLSAVDARLAHPRDDVDRLIGRLVHHALRGTNDGAVYVPAVRRVYLSDLQPTPHQVALWCHRSHFSPPSADR
ncbi:hypothetical protein [Kribbella deserti]|uniref:Uncharacterized protein n=1 Tax=Kribbella deserti TaxID=1926257 RepID=A0ABV6QQU9_9ACTN